MLYVDFVMRVILAVLLGFCIGLERQITGHAAGIRINILISLGGSLSVYFISFDMRLG